MMIGLFYDRRNYFKLRVASTVARSVQWWRWHRAGRSEGNEDWTHHRDSQVERLEALLSLFRRGSGSSSCDFSCSDRQACPFPPHCTPEQDHGIWAKGVPLTWVVAWSYSSCIFCSKYLTAERLACLFSQAAAYLANIFINSPQWCPSLFPDFWS